MKYFRIKNFEKFQNQLKSSSQPSWIRLYTALLDDYEFGDLPDKEKGQLLMLWLLASRKENKLPWDSEWLKTKCSLQGEIDLGLLMQTGFIETIDDNAETPMQEKKMDSPKSSNDRKKEILAKFENFEEMWLEKADESFNNNINLL